MYMIGWLCMLKIYQIRHPDINPQAHIAYFCAAFVILIAVIGVVSPHSKGPFTPSVSVNVATTLQLLVILTITSYFVLTENNGVAKKWVATPFWSDSIVFNESRIASIIAELLQR